jgi:3-methylfumaryl-CoA hydratase
MDLCRRERPGARLAKFSFRAVSPLFDTAPFAVEGKPSADGRSAELWARGPDGALAMSASAEFG